MSKPRKHHYCPESFLARFTMEGTKDGVLWVMDRSKKEVRKSKPKEQAHQRDFYRIEVDEGNDPFYLEKEFSTIESGAIAAIDYMIANKTLPDEEAMGFLLSFVGLLSVRIPSFRQKIESFNERVAKMVVDIACADEERFELHKKRMRAAGTEVSDEVSFADMREFIEKDKFTIETHQNDFLQTMLHSANTITDLLIKRNWSIAFAKESDFVCSDNPVGLVWTNPPKGMWQSPGFGLPGTEVVVPLSRSVALLGTFEDMPFEVGEFDQLGVASLNSIVAGRASRFVYCPTDNFAWRNENGDFQSVTEYFAVKSEDE